MKNISLLTSLEIKFLSVNPAHTFCSFRPFRAQHREKVFEGEDIEAGLAFSQTVCECAFVPKSHEEEEMYRARRRKEGRRGALW